MSETVRKLCKKTKLMSRDSTNFNLDLQEPAHKKIHLDTKKKGSYDNESHNPSTSRGDKGIGESGPDPSNYMKFLFSLSQDDEPDEVLTSGTVSPEPDENTLSPEKNLVPEDDKKIILDIGKIKEMLAMLHEMYPDETEVVIHTRNQWGKFFYERYPSDVQRSVQDCLLQDVIMQWRRWNVKGKIERQSPFCYKCYICDKAWWSLEELCTHTKIHNTCKFKLEPSHDECNIVAYVGNSPRFKDLPIDGKCLKCAKTYDYHVTSKKLSDKFYYCNYCYRMFETCRALNVHKGVCDSNTVVSENRKQLIFSDCPCQICNTDLLSDSQLSDHFLICHSVRSDEPIVTFSKTCWICNEVYYDKDYHVCLKKLVGYVCVYCQSKFRTKQLLNCHLEMWDGGVRCRICNKFFMRQCMAWEHYVEHSVDFLIVHQCVECDSIKVFKTEDELNVHRRTHHRTSYTFQDRIILPKIMLQQWMVDENATAKDVVNLLESSSENDNFSEKSEEESQMPYTTVAHDDFSKHSIEVLSENNTIEIKEEKDDENDPSTHNKEVPGEENFESSNRVIVKEEDIDIFEVSDTEHLKENSNAEKDDENEPPTHNKEVPGKESFENSNRVIVKEEDIDIFEVSDTEHLKENSNAEKDYENEPSTHNKEVPGKENFENSNRVIVKEEDIEIFELSDTEHLEENSNAEKDDENEPSTHNKEVTAKENFENSNRVIVKEEDIDIFEVSDTEHLEENSNADKDGENETLKLNEDVPEGDHLENSNKIIEKVRITQDNLCGKENENNKVLPKQIEEFNEFLDLKPDIVALKEDNLSDDEDDLKIVETEYAESDISKVLLAPSTFAEEVTENSEHSQVFQVSKNILKSESIVVKKAIKEEQKDELIVLDSSDSEQEVCGTSTNSDHNILNLEPEAILQAGYRKRKIYRCTKCDFSAYHKEYREHVNSNCRKVRRMIPNMYCKCTKCHQTFPNLRKYALHFKKHGFAAQTCPQCWAVFETTTKLAQHLNTHIKKQFLRISVLSDKEEKNKNNKRYQCKDCKKIGETNDSFTHWEGHLKLNEPEKFPELVPFKVSGKGQHALKPSALKEVIAKLQEEKYQMSTCFHCSRTFSFPRRDDTKRHLIEHLLEDAFANIVDNHLLKCQICNELHKKPEYYKKHMRDHASLPIYQCSICDKTFSDSSNFTKHKKTHNLVSFVCDICNNKFQRKESLEKHIQIHMTTAPIHCPLCNKVFPCESLFKKHLRAMHCQPGPPRPLRCRMCSATFFNYKARSKHLWLVHQQRSKAADCPVCARAFRTSTEVQRHARAAHGRGDSRGDGDRDSGEDCLLVEDETETLIVLD